jgi:predicted dehydrogenase
MTTLDALHDHYIVMAVEAGCRVVTEKPMTVTGDKCRRILNTTANTGKPLTVAFNYRLIRPTPRQTPLRPHP